MLLSHGWVRARLGSLLRGGRAIGGTAIEQQREPYGSTIANAPSKRGLRVVLSGFGVPMPVLASPSAFPESLLCPCGRDGGQNRPVVGLIGGLPDHLHVGHGALGVVDDDSPRQQVGG